MGCGDRKSTWLARTPTGTAISDHSPVKRKMSGASHSAPSCPPQRTSQGPQQGWTDPPDLRVLPAAAHQTGSHLCLFDQSLAQTCSFRKRHTCCFSCPPPHHQLPTGLSPLHREGLFAANSRIRLRSLFSQWSCAPGAAPGCSPAWQPSRAQRAKAQPLNWENQRPSWLEAVHRKLTLRPILRHNRPGPSQFTAKYS